MSGTYYQLQRFHRPELPGAERALGSRGPLKNVHWLEKGVWGGVHNTPGKRCVRPPGRRLCGNIPCPAKSCSQA